MFIIDSEMQMCTQFPVSRTDRYKNYNSSVGVVVVPRAIGVVRCIGLIRYTGDGSIVYLLTVLVVLVG